MIGFVGPIRAAEMESCVAAGLRPVWTAQSPVTTLDRATPHDADGLCRRSQRDGVAANILGQEA